MEKPTKPELETQIVNGIYGELIVQFTPESEISWANYMRQENMYRQSIGSLALRDEAI